MKISDIAALRLTNQQLTASTFKTANEIVEWFGAMQVQEYAQAKWAIGMRLENTNDSVIETSFTKGDLLRTHILRPTWHFVSARDIRWMVQLTAPRVKAVNSFMYRKMELTDKLFYKTTSIIIKALEGRNHLTRTALNETLLKNKIVADGIRLSCIMMQAELDGIICSGPRIGKQFTYALLDERVPETPEFSTEEALAELSKRYFLSRGPATCKDFATWSGLTLTDAKKGLNMIKHMLSSEIIEKEEYFFPPSTAINNSFKEMLLLPIYDEYIMGYKDRAAILDHKNKYAPNTPFVFDNTLMYDGQIVGTWKRTIQKNHITLEHLFFDPANKNYQKAFMRSVKKYEEFQQLPVQLLTVNK